MTEKTMEKTALYDEHVKKGGKLVPFAGYKLPIWFSSLKEEHLIVREKVGVFDISHMGLLWIEGEKAFDFLQKLTSNDLTPALKNKMVYAMILNEQGMILDDVTVGKLGDGFLVVVNAANKSKIVGWMQNHKEADVVIEDMNTTHSFIAVQGPGAVEKVSRIYQTDLNDMSRFAAQYLS